MPSSTTPGQVPACRARAIMSPYARGLDGLWGMCQWLDRAPKGRNETGVWWRRHDEYGPLPQNADSRCHAAEAYA